MRLDGGVTMTLPLQPHLKASSWGSLLREYELWALDDDDIHRQFCAELLRELPAGVRGHAAPGRTSCTWSCGTSPMSRSRSSTT